MEIKNRYDGRVIFTSNHNTMRESVEAAVRAGVSLAKANLFGVDLYGADLRGANLRGADLRGADLEGADLWHALLRGANLWRANLGGANLGGANLRGANLRGANLRGANLEGANLQRANLRGADLGLALLVGANLRGADLLEANLRGADLLEANLRGANLRGADLTGCDISDVIEDIYDVLASSPAEVPGLLKALKAGKVDGSTYQGACACLVGTIANLKGCNYGLIPELKPDSERPAERWFFNIYPGHTPKNSPIVAQTVEWVEEWLLSNPTAKLV